MSFLSRLAPIFNGVMRTMVIATEACYAAAVMFPFGFMAQTAGDIVHRADVCTDATLDATLVPDVEWLVSNQVIQKVFTYYSGVYSRPTPFMEHENMVLPFFYNRDILLQVLRSLLLLGPFFLLLVYVHERQSHVRLGHNQRESRIQMQAANRASGSRQSRQSCRPLCKRSTHILPHP